MGENSPGSEIQARMARDANELDERIARLDDHIGDARGKAAERREEAQPLEAVAGDWEDTAPLRPGGDDDAESFDDPEADEDEEEEEEEDGAAEEDDDDEA